MWEFCCPLIVPTHRRNAFKNDTQKLVFKFLEGTCPFMGPLIPLFWTSGDVSSGFQYQSGQSYSHLVQAYVMYIPKDSPMVQHLLTS